MKRILYLNIINSMFKNKCHGDSHRHGTLLKELIQKLLLTFACPTIASDMFTNMDGLAIHFSIIGLDSIELAS